MRTASREFTVMSFSHEFRKELKISESQLEEDIVEKLVEDFYNINLAETDANNSDLKLVCEMIIDMMLESQHNYYCDGEISFTVKVSETKLYQSLKSFTISPSICSDVSSKTIGILGIPEIMNIS